MPLNNLRKLCWLCHDFVTFKDQLKTTSYSIWRHSCVCETLCVCVLKHSSQCLLVWHHDKIQSNQPVSSRALWACFVLGHKYQDTWRCHAYLLEQLCINKDDAKHCQMTGNLQSGLRTKKSYDLEPWTLEWWTGVPHKSNLWAELKS